MRFAALVALGLLCFSDVGHASTIHPNDVDAIFTEGGRTTTVSGESISGNAVASGNTDINRHYIDGSPDTNSYLLSGSLDGSDMDRWIFRGITGLFSVNLHSFAAASTHSSGAFSGTFSISIDGINAGSISLSGSAGQTLSHLFGSFQLDNANVLIEANGVSGISNYDLSVDIATTPLPTSGLLLGAGLFGVGAWMRRRKRSL